MAVYDSYLYWTDWIMRAVVRVNKFTGADFAYVRRGFSRQPMGIIVVAEDALICKDIHESSSPSRISKYCISIFSQVISMLALSTMGSYAKIFVSWTNLVDHDVAALEIAC